LHRRYADWDRQFVDILTAVPNFGVQAVDQACRHALKMRTVSKEVVLNLLYRAEDEASTDGIDIGAHLHLKCRPVADCGRYDRLIKEAPHAAQ
jgi:hypothetical protein